MTWFNKDKTAMLELDEVYYYKFDKEAQIFLDKGTWLRNPKYVISSKIVLYLKSGNGLSFFGDEAVEILNLFNEYPRLSA